MLTYKKTASRIEVRLDNTLVGAIYNVPGGWQYKPKGGRNSGEVFSTVNECKRSLEGN